MGKFLRWAFASLAVLVLTAIFEPPLMAFFKTLGWHNPPNEFASNVVNWLASLTGEAAFPWLASGVLGATFGSWAHFLATHADRRSPTKSRRFQDLTDLIGNVKDEWTEGLKEEGGAYNFAKKNYQSSLRLKALYAELRKVGLRQPDYEGASAFEYNIGHHNYLQVLEPFAARGLLAEAKAEARKAQTDFKPRNSEEPIARRDWSRKAAVNFPRANLLRMFTSLSPAKSAAKGLRFVGAFDTQGRYFAKRD